MVGLGGGPLWSPAVPFVRFVQLVCLFRFGCDAGDHKGSPPIILPALAPTALGGGLYDAFAAGGPPAGDAAEDHDDAAEPDEGGERVDEDTDAGLGCACPVGEQDVEVAQVVVGNGDQAGRLVGKVRVEGAARIEIAQELAVVPDLQLRRYGFGAGILGVDIAEKGELVAGDRHLLAGVQHGVLLCLKEVRAYYANGEHNQTKMHDIATVALAIALDESVERDGIGLAVLVAHAHPAPEFVKYGSGGKGADGKTDVGRDSAHTCQRQDGGTGGSRQRWDAEVAPQGAQRRAPPRQQGTNAHRQDQQGEERPIDILVERSAHRHRLVAHGG